MGRRGTELREHILWSATDAFLEVGFERASMDLVAARSGASKRTVYAHFESKENLYLAVIEAVRGVVLDRLGLPGDYSRDPEEALVLFCGRYLEILRYEPAVQMCRVSISEAARFPQGAERHFAALFTEAELRLGAFLSATYGLEDELGHEAARRLLGQILYPQLLRHLFGVDEPVRSYDPEATVPNFDLTPVRKSVVDAIGALPGR